MATQPVREKRPLEGLRDPVLITAFNSYTKGGATAPASLAYALTQWDAQLVAEFDAADCYINDRLRPWVRRHGETASIEWPQNLVYRVEAPRRSILVLIGVEPNLNWREFSAAIVEFASRHGVQLALNLKAVPAGVPHTMFAPVKAVYSDPAMEATYRVEVLQEQDGPADIGRVVNFYLAEAGCETIDLYALEPFYSGATPDAGAGVTLLRTLSRMLGIEVDSAQMEEAAVMQRRAIDAVVASSEQMRETVLALEQRSRGASFPQGEAPLLVAGNPAGNLDAAEVLSDVEDFLQSLRRSGN
jgi:proteasome assembly chaperone (PAC2) family protein